MISKQIVKRVTSFMLISSMLIFPNSFAVHAAGNSDYLLASQIMDDGKVNLDIAAGVAGVALNLDGYYSAVASDDVSAKTEIELKKLVDKKAAVLNDYKKIGIADVNGSNYLNVRKKPSTSADICGKMTKNTACEILEKDGDWYKVRSGSVTGYVYAEYMITGTKAQEIAIAEAEKMAVVTTKSNLNVRKKPSTESSIITKISTEERYEVKSVKDGWVKISLDGLLDENGDAVDSAGYISAEFCTVKYALKAAIPYTPLDEKGTSGYTSTRASLCNYACRFIGNPYVWGGTSLTRGADCSGFVKSVFANYGIYLPRTSGAQANAGRRINASQMKPGDLVFYGSGRINHVAIYIGGGRIVHAANTRRGIVINSWNYMTPVRIVSVLGD